MTTKQKLQTLSERLNWLDYERSVLFGALKNLCSVETKEEAIQMMNALTLIDDPSAVASKRALGVLIGLWPKDDLKYE